MARSHAWRPRRMAGAAAVFLALAAPAAAQTAEPLNFQWIGVNLTAFPQIYVDWQLGTASGSELSASVGMSIQVPRGTPSGSTAEITFRDAATSTIYCRVDISMPSANGCIPQPPTTARCTVVSGGMGGGMCQMRVQFNP